MDEFGTSLPREILGLAVLSDIYAGALLERAVYAVARLGVADVLTEQGPLSVDHLAQAVECLPQPLHRIMRLLAARGVFEEVAPGHFGHTPASECLRSDVPWSFRWTFLASGSDEAGTEVTHVIRTGRSGFEKATGRSFWEYLSEDRRAAAEFAAQMRCEARTMALPLIAQHDFGASTTVVDVGGGQGHVLAAVLRSAPHLTGVLVERGEAIEHGRATFERAGVIDRCKLVEGDFFEGVPAGADTYLLSRVLHDWADDSAVEILRRVRSAISDDGTLLVLEMILEGGNFRTLVSDVLMLTVFGVGRERSHDEFENLLREASFAVESVTSSLTPLKMIVARPV